MIMSGPEASRRPLLPRLLLLPPLLPPPVAHRANRAGRCAPRGDSDTPPAGADFAANADEGEADPSLEPLNSKAKEKDCEISCAASCINKPR